MAFLLSRALFSRHQNGNQREHHNHRNDATARNDGGREDLPAPSTVAHQSTQRQQRRRRERRERRERRSRRTGTSSTSSPPSVDINDLLEAALNNIIDAGSKGPTPPASKDFMNSLIHLRMRNLSSLQQHPSSCPNETYAECSICAQPYHEKDVVCMLPCVGGNRCSSGGGSGGGHMYHSDCIMDWLERKCTCPTCRCEFPTDDPVFELQRRLRQQQEQQKIKRQEHAVEGHEGSDDDSTSNNSDGDSYGCHYQGDFMFLPPNLSVPLGEDEEQDSSSTTGSATSSSDDGSSSLSTSGSPSTNESNEHQHQQHEHRGRHYHPHHHHHHHRDGGGDGSYQDDDFFHQNQNFDLIMRRVLRSKAKYGHNGNISNNNNNNKNFISMSIRSKNHG
eukprot:CAMPEP_0113462110 /NCGR_PEP_ID=MMETSP0014_2-20120614/11907_1 /TAXON_ID=2857 /ORGANISM="Nitzschia sp." /LENGTH=390 /DNA_ID=CAMNT_0000353931 /DNA_START=393 /DNA_END=1566 /DNA_ORIENTATION=- /assembly_acc=CAM_ASM_000159